MGIWQLKGEQDARASLGAALASEIIFLFMLVVFIYSAVKT